MKPHSVVKPFLSSLLGICTIIGGVAIIWLPSSWSSWTGRNGHLFATVSLASTSAAIAVAMSTRHQRELLRAHHSTELAEATTHRKEELREHERRGYEAGHADALRTRNAELIEAREDLSLLRERFQLWPVTSSLFEELRDNADDQRVLRDISDAVIRTAEDWANKDRLFTLFNSAQTRRIYRRSFEAFQNYSRELRENYSNYYQGEDLSPHLRIDGADYRAREMRARSAARAHDELIEAITIANTEIDRLEREITRLESL